MLILGLYLIEHPIIKLSQYLPIYSTIFDFQTVHSIQFEEALYVFYKVPKM